MARRENLIKRKPKATKTRSDNKFTNIRMYGAEIKFTKPLTDTQYGNALTWYNYNCDVNDARQYMNTFLTNNGLLDESKAVKDIPDNYVPFTACWIARMLNQGFSIPSDGEAFIYDKILDLVERFKPANKVVEINSAQSYLEKQKDQINEMIGEIEYQVDNNTDFNLYDWLKEKNYPTQYADIIVDKYIPWLEELVDLTLVEETLDDSLLEGYLNWSDETIEERIVFFTKLIEDASKYSTTKRVVVRKPRKTKPITPEKILKTFKCKKEDAELHVKSVDPRTVLKSQELWMYSTVYKTLTYLKALDENGISVKGTTFINVNESISCTKRIGRNGESFIKRVLTDGKVAIKKIMSDIKTGEAKLQLRSNEDILLLRVI